MTAQPSSPFDFSPMLKTYMESVELWKKNYENVMKSAKDTQDTSAANEAAAPVKHSSAGASASDAALMNWSKSGGDLFKRFVENQIELCHFFSSRWEQYLKLPQQLSQCRSLTELGTSAELVPKPVREGLYARDGEARASGRRTDDKFEQLEERIRTVYDCGEQCSTRDTALPHLPFCLNSKAKPHSLAINGLWRGQ